jgi:MscS family membrane protein
MPKGVESDWTMASSRKLETQLARILAVLGFVLLKATVIQAAPALAQPVLAVEKPVASALEDVDEVIAADSPRASVESYLSLCKQSRYKDAARYLSIPASQTARSAELARRLKAVLDSDFAIDIDALSPKSEGSKSDALPPGHEQFGQPSGAHGKLGPLNLVKKAYPVSEARWVFSRSTVEQIDGWYDRLDQRWFLDHLPKYLLRPGPRDLLIWQWIALPLLVVASWLLGIPLSRASRGTFSLFAKRSHAIWGDSLVAQLRGPLTLTWMLLLIYLALPWLGLRLLAEDFAKGLLKGGFLFAFFWVLSRLIDVWGNVIMGSEWGKAHTASSSLVTLGVRLAKIAVLVIAIIALVSSSGYPIASLLAGLGVGGLALALAAQKTVENLFGAFALGADQPFRVGDFIRVDDITGTVESIGLRSTRIRTLDRTLISIPNGKLSELRIESFAPRDRFLLQCKLGLVYATTPDQIRQLLETLEQRLLAHPKIWPENLVVRFVEFGTSTLNIEIMAWFLTSDFAEFQSVRQDVLLGFMDAVNDAGTSFAFPTQTVHLVRDA